MEAIGKAGGPAQLRSGLCWPWWGNDATEGFYPFLRFYMGQADVWIDKDTRINNLRPKDLAHWVAEINRALLIDALKKGQRC